MAGRRIVLDLSSFDHQWVREVCPVLASEFSGQAWREMSRFTTYRINPRDCAGMECNTGSCRLLKKIKPSREAMALRRVKAREEKSRQRAAQT